MKDKNLILIAGGTASGKSMVAEQLKNEYKKLGKEIALITLDNYYKTLDQLEVKHHSEVNWDDPKVLDWERLKKDINSLLDGQSITIREYNYGTGFYNEEEFIVPNSKVIIFEGIFALFDEEIRKLADIKIYVDVDSDTRMIRRIKRDSQSRYGGKFDSEGFVEKWETLIKPMHNKFIQPTLEYADLIIKNNKELDNKEKSSLIELFRTLVVK